MSDDSSPPELGRRRRVIEAVRRRLQRVEIETHQIRADLAQFEAVHEAGVAATLRGGLELEHVEAPACNLDAESAVNKPSTNSELKWELTAPVVRADLSPRHRRVVKGEAAAADFSAIRLQIGTEGEQVHRRSLVARWASSAWLVSVLVHFALLAVGGSLTYAILVDESPPHMMTLDLSADVVATTSEAAPPELVDVAESDSTEVATGDGPMNLADLPVADLLPFTADKDGESIAGLGELDAVPTETGTLMAGLGTEGKPGVARTGPGGGSREGVVGGHGHGGKPGHRAKLNSIEFFGTEAIGDRIVFLVDKSGSMKQGRMETTVLELLRSINAMTKDQSFYIVFYSDQAYPVFYPKNELHFVVATPENKRRLVPWLQTLELCSGGKLVEAIELAASLHPDVVYILSDGDINSPRTMQKMTEANDWEFVIHTLGMGVKKPMAAENLNAIAQAHHGTFQMVQADPAVVQAARQHPIRSNPTGVAWGTGGVVRKP